MEWVYVILVICVLLSLWVFLSTQNEPIRETGTFGLAGINALSWYNQPNQCWHGLYSQGCSTDHQIYGF